MVKKICSLVAMFMLCIIAFNTVNVYATDSGTEYMSLDKDVQLDSSHSIHIHADAYVDYSYDEGIYGWINNVEILGDGGVGSDNVRTDTLQAVDEKDFGSSSYWIRYLWCGTSFLNDYRGYITLHYEVDEYGDLTAYITYQKDN